LLVGTSAPRRCSGAPSGRLHGREALDCRPGSVPPFALAALLGEQHQGSATSRAAARITDRPRPVNGPPDAPGRRRLAPSPTRLTVTSMASRRTEHVLF